MNTTSLANFTWGKAYNLYTLAAEEHRGSSRIVSPLGSFFYRAGQTEAVVSLRLESNDTHWGDFAIKLQQNMNQDEALKKFESPVFFRTNIENGLGVFGSTVIHKQEISIALN